MPLMYLRSCVGLSNFGLALGSPPRGRVNLDSVSENGTHLSCLPLAGSAELDYWILGRQMLLGGAVLYSTRKLPIPGIGFPSSKLL
jgi:hypothetical protein